ncbi:Transcription initiation factor TFIID subunit 4B, partial [Galemys pyrenaicus]
MAGVNLNEENACILATNSKLVGTLVQSCKDEPFLFIGALQKKILDIGKKHDITELNSDAVNLISHATQERLRGLLEKLTTVAQHRMTTYKASENYILSSDTKSQLKFLEKLDQLEKQRKDLEEREMLLKAAKLRDDLAHSLSTSRIRYDILGNPPAITTQLPKRATVVFWVAVMAWTVVISLSTLPKLSWITLARKTQAVGGAEGTDDSLEGIVVLLMIYTHHKHGDISKASEVMTLLTPPFNRSNKEDPEQLRLKQKAKELQQLELAQIQHRDANLTALAAIGPRKKRPLEPGSGS